MHREAGEDAFSASRSPHPAPRSSAAHHADWLSLIEVSGPFVSLLVLQRVFPAGLPRLEAGDTRAMREAYAQWQDHPQAPGAQRAWLWHGLTLGLGYLEDRLAEGQALPAGLEARVSTVGETVLYEAALMVMMRLVFLFSAEERGLLHLGKPLYDENYAVSTLQAQLQEVADRYGEEVLERRSDAWARLLATFRAMHGGIAHQDLS
jgi:hypothetical protein